MSNVSAASVANRALRTALPNRARAAVLVASALGLIVSSSRTAAAQSFAPEVKKWELRVSDGALVATGSQRNSLKDARMTAAQLSWLVRPTLAITGTFGWARSRDVASASAAKLDVFTSDIGVEARPAHWSLTRSVTFSPFVGVGAGVRSYNYRKLDVDATNNLAGYGAIGGQLGVRRVGLRVEMRDYATGFKPLASVGQSEVRNDLTVVAAVSFRFRGASKQD